MQGIKLTCFNDVWLRGDTSFDLSKVIGVEPARLQGEDVTFSMEWEISQETMQAFMDAMQDPETDNSGPQAFYLESE
jgi:hypothetical protein